MAKQDFLHAFHERLGKFAGGQIDSSEGDLLHISNTCFGFGGIHANGDGYGYILNITSDNVKVKGINFKAGASLIIPDFPDE